MSWPTELRGLVADFFENKEDKPPEAKPKPEPPPDRIREAMKEIRGNLRRVGAVLAAGATALLTGLGYAQLHHIFPAPSNHRILVPLVGASVCWRRSSVPAGSCASSSSPSARFPSPATTISATWVTLTRRK